MNSTKIQDAMSEVLSAMFFDAMASDVLNVADDDIDTLRRYARVIVKNLNREGRPEESRRAANLFRMHRPALY